MTVAQLIAELQKLPPDAPVVVDDTDYGTRLVERLDYNETVQDGRVYIDFKL